MADGGGSIVIPIIVIFAGYTIASYGVCLLRDYDISWKSWIDPMDPWQWPADGMANHKIPAGQLWPGPASASSSGSAPTGEQQKIENRILHELPGDLWRTFKQLLPWG